MAAQAAVAGQAIGETLARMKQEVKDSADLVAWARKYPWPTMGAAAALGFMAASQMGAKNAERPAADVLAEALAARGAGPPPKPSMFSGLMNELIRSFAGALEGAIAGVVSSRMQQATSPSGNGHDGPMHDGPMPGGPMQDGPSDDKPAPPPSDIG